MMMKWSSHHHHYILEFLVASKTIDGNAKAFSKERNIEEEEENKY